MDIYMSIQSIGSLHDVLQGHNNLNVAYKLLITYTHFSMQLTLILYMYLYTVTVGCSTLDRFQCYRKYV